MSNLIDCIKKRYATKAFNPLKKISSQQLDQLKTLLQFSPSSVNIQPWHFIIASSDSGKKLIAQSTVDFIYNTPKILSASHVIILCSKTKITEQYLEQLIAQEQKDGRFTTEQDKLAASNARTFFTQHHNETLNDTSSWIEKQVYLALGNLILGASLLGIDSCPIEGFDAQKINTLLDLDEKGYRASVILALGYHGENDFNAHLPKSRLPQEAIFSTL